MKMRVGYIQENYSLGIKFIIKLQGRFLFQNYDIQKGNSIETENTEL
jgi:hypothetical protein